MALVRFNDTLKLQPVSPKRGAAIWRILNKEQSVKTDKDRQYMSRVQTVYLNRENAPDSYLRARGLTRPKQPEPQQIRLI